MQKLICITGIDGSGKTTLIKNIQELNNNICIAEIWDLFQNNCGAFLFKNKNDIDKYLCGLTPNSRLLFLAHAISFSIEKAIKSDKEIIITNSYFFKYFATEYVLGADIKLINALMNNFPNTLINIKLEISPEISVKRKQGFSHYECGVKNENNEYNFLRFQEEVNNAWNIFTEYNFTQIDALQSLEYKTKICTDIINSL